MAVMARPPIAATLVNEQFSTYSNGALPAKWTKAGTWTVTSGVLKCTDATTDRLAYLTGVTLPTNHWVEIDITSSEGADEWYGIGPATKCGASSWNQLTVGTGSWWTGNAADAIHLPILVTNPMPTTARIEVRGQYVTYYIGGRRIGQYKDTSSTGNAPGIYRANGTTCGVTAIRAGALTESKGANPGIKLGVAGDGNESYMNSTQLNAMLARVKALGCDHYRATADWWLTEDTQGVRDWSAFDRINTACATAGLELVTILSYAAPLWARGSGPTTGNCPPDSAHIANYANFCAAAATRATACTVFELWNEPNVRTFWGINQNVSLYVSMLQAAYTAVKAARPDAIVLCGALAPEATVGTDTTSPLDFMTAVYAGGGKNYFDAVSIHPYTSPGHPWGPEDWMSLNAAVLPIRELMIAQGDGLKPMWFTEWGYPTGGTDSVTEAVQATEMVDALALWRGLGYAAAATLYSLDDRNSAGTDREDRFGIYQSGGTAKPAVAALKTLAKSWGRTTS